MICNLCNGDGLVNKLICGQCLGTGKIMEEEKVETPVEETIETPTEESFTEDSGENCEATAVAEEVAE